MTWSILFAFLIVVAIMSLTGRRQVPWSHKMSRRNAGTRHKAEWTAPDPVITRVKADYLGAMRWLEDSVSQRWSEQWNAVPYYFSGSCLKRHQEILKRYRIGQVMRYAGILKSSHDVSVRHFSEDGERCLVLDYQGSRRITTYNLHTKERLATQRLGDGTLVYEMVYDKQARRWKVNRFIQQLPVGWHHRKSSRQMRVLTALPPAIGRDN